MAHNTHTHQETDAKAAFTGLIVGAIVLFLIVVGIVKWTNAQFAGHAPAAAAETHK